MVKRRDLEKVVLAWSNVVLDRSIDPFNVVRRPQANTRTRAARHFFHDIKSLPIEKESSNGKLANRIGKVIVPQQRYNTSATTQRGRREKPAAASS
jgi:hypothetical protein